MLLQPTVVERPAQIYAGRRETIAMTEFARVADHLPGMFAWLGERGVTPAGAPFFRYRGIHMTAELLVDAGIPLAEPIEVDEPTFLDVLPAGRYATVTHVGHPDELMGVTAGLLDWAQHEGLEWDMTPTPDGEEWAARLEVLMTNPAEQPDMHKWETALLFKLR
ncbi:GyrI-like domain-containing protein [Actinoplanes sp. N902-109]|uniref:GyrI-like domain-containing protein n=1 Tax=Actinoplanes sp. (strain N902-109) TaxID=649831 RepID=UPI0003296398|nr:GyrI-like domain-containing protein [Actinoplanes sp. N902-109]AGL19466.1 transcription activator [Actinoplanes sp. N902-109]